MGQEILDDRRRAAGEDYVRRYEAEVGPVEFAGWIRPVDKDWKLNVVPVLAPGERVNSYYNAMLNVLWGLKNPYLTFLDVRLVPPDSRLAEGIRELWELVPRDVPYRFTGFLLGDVPVEDSYLYPPPAPAKAG